MNEPAIIALSSLGSLFGLAILMYWLRADYRIDLFRERMFALRDQLFDFAAAGGVSFDHPAYGLLRSTMNGYIRFAHRMLPLNILILIVLTKGGPNYEATFGFEKRWGRAIADLDEPAKKLMVECRMAMEGMGLLHAAPWLRPLFRIVRAIVRLRVGARDSLAALSGAAKRLQARLSSQGALIDSVAMTAGDLRA